MDDGWVHPLAKTLPSPIINLWWHIVMDDWNLDEKTLSKWQGMTNNVGWTFSVGDTRLWCTISVEQDT